MLIRREPEDSPPIAPSVAEHVIHTKELYKL